MNKYWIKTQMNDFLKIIIIKNSFIILIEGKNINNTDDSENKSRQPNFSLTNILPVYKFI